MRHIRMQSIHKVHYICLHVFVYAGSQIVSMKVKGVKWVSYVSIYKDSPALVCVHGGSTIVGIKV